MMKKILSLGMLCLVGAPVWAANPFTDVSTSDWAYRAVSDLSDRGMVEGYPDGTFRGEKNITRYELAQIVARLMAKEDRMNAEDRAIVDRLAAEYATELENLGVRVSDLEKKVGNITWSGDARLRFQKSDGASARYNARMRINVNATVNDTTYVRARITSGNFNLKTGGSTELYIDRMYVHHQFGAVGATLGRFELKLGQQAGGWMYSNSFDGIELAAPIAKKTDLFLGYGRLSAKDSRRDYRADSMQRAETFYARVKTNLRGVKLGVDYVKVAPYTDFADGEKNRKSVWGVNLTVPVQKWRIFADFYEDLKINTVAGQKGRIWTVGVGYGKIDYKKPGSFTADIGYFKTKAGLVEVASSLDVMKTKDLFDTDGRLFLANADVTLAKNTYLHGEYIFGSKNDAGVSADGWALSMNYKF